MAKTFTCTIVSPTEQLLDDEVTFASIPLWDGLMGVLPGRAPLVAALGTGALRIDFPNEGGAEGGSRYYFIDGGVCKMGDGKLTIVAESAIPAERLVTAEAREELQQAESMRIEDETDPEKRRVARERRAHAIEAARQKLRLAESRAGKGI